MHANYVSGSGGASASLTATSQQGEERPVLARYLRLQLFMLVCGIVGPIFLIMYFASGQPSDQIWMLYGGALVTVIDFLIPLAITFLGAKSATKAAELEQRGVLALAQITGLAETGTTINDQPVVKVNLHISGPGFTPFDSQDRVRAGVARLGSLTARKLVVVVDPATQEYRIDWERSALVNGLVPAQFNVAEDNRTYDLSGQAGPLMEILQIYKANKLPFGGTVDLRAYPAVRQQIMAVVRRAAAQQQPAPAAAGVGAAAAGIAPPQASVAQRLQELEALHKSGALSPEEYASKRAQIISDI